MIKTKCFIEHEGKTIKKLFVAGNVVKGEIKSNLFILTLASYKGKDVKSEFTTIAVSDPNKIEFLKKLNKGTLLFCENNVVEKESNGKVYENLYLFNFIVGKEGKGSPLIEEEVNDIEKYI